MNFDKQLALVGKLYEKTLEGEVDWKPSVRENSFQVSFAHYSVRLSQIEQQYENYYVIEIINENGEVADSISDSDLTSSETKGPGDLSWYNTLEQLHHRARRIALGAEKAIDEIMKELDLPAFLR